MTSVESTSPPFNLRKAMPVIIGAVVVLVAVVAVLSGRSGSAAKPVNGVMTFVDAGKRLGAAEILDPRTNVQREMLGEFPPDCVITINGKPAELSDVRVGDKVKVVASVVKEERPSGAQAIVKSVEVVR